jgi:hypothetical protein
MLGGDANLAVYCVGGGPCDVGGGGGSQLPGVAPVRAGSAWSASYSRYVMVTINLKCSVSPFTAASLLQSHCVNSSKMASWVM